jgi:hypothetical protein
VNRPATFEPNAIKLNGKGTPLDIVHLMNN